jgi:serine phosphatase RsbU (regulator of sigma subunit)
MTDQISLWVRAADGSVFERLVQSDALVVGRSAFADLSLQDRALSRLHARFVRDTDGWRVEDMGSRNGTLLNGEPVGSSAPVTHGDEVTVGATILRVLQPDGSTPRRRDGDDTGGTIVRPAAELVAPTEPTDRDPVALTALVDRLGERLRVLLDVQRALAGSIDQHELLELILDRAFELLRPEQAAIFLCAADGTTHLAAGRSTAGGDPASLHSRSLMREVIERGNAALVMDTETDARFNEAVSLVNVGLRSLVAAPLSLEDEVIGMIALGSRLAVRQFSEDDLELLASLAAVVATRIHNLRLADEAAERRRMERELELARQIQEALLPTRLPTPPGWKLVARNTPSRGVSGDFYTVVDRDGKLALMVADVSGKGVGAALLTASLEALTASALDRGESPDEVCASVSRLLAARTPRSKFATAFLAVLDPETGDLVASNAGHNPALVVRADGSVEEIEATGVPLGLVPEMRYDARRVQLEPGDLLAVYTDGITEARTATHDEYGVERLSEVLRAGRTLELVELVEAVRVDLETFVDGEPFADDRTLLLIRREP